MASLTYTKAEAREPENTRWNVLVDGECVGQVAGMPLGYFKGVGPEHSDIKTETRFEAAHWLATRMGKTV